MSKQQGRDCWFSAMRYVSGRTKSVGAVFTHLLGLGFDDVVIHGVIDSLITKGIVVRDAYGSIQVDPSLMHWHRSGRTRTSDRYKRWNGKRWEHRYVDKYSGGPCAAEMHDRTSREIASAA